MQCALKGGGGGQTLQISRRQQPNVCCTEFCTTSTAIFSTVKVSKSKQQIVRQGKTESRDKIKFITNITDNVLHHGTEHIKIIKSSALKNFT